MFSFLMSKNGSMIYVGYLLTFVGFLIAFSHKVIYHEILKGVLSLTPTSQSFEFWKESVAPISFDVYFFNWTNPEDIEDPMTKPKLVELGPYSFSLNIQKINTTFHNNNTVSYHTKKTWVFNESKSKGSLQDKVIQLNTVAVTAGHKTRFWDKMFKRFTSDQLDDHSNNISITKSIEELLFKGFNDSFMEMSRQFDENPAPFDAFAWFYMRNGSTEFDGYSNVATGVGNLDDLGKIKQWNNKDTTDYYSSPHNFVEGAGDYLFPPYRTKESIKFFNVDLCQTISNEFDGETYEKGIAGYKFHMDQKTLGDNTQQCDATTPRAPQEVFFVDQENDDTKGVPTTTEDDFSWDDMAGDFSNSGDGNEAGDVTTLSSVDEEGTTAFDAAASNADLYVDGLETTLQPEHEEEEEEDEEEDDGGAVVNEGTENNPCHCNGECSPVGLINVTACRYGVPIFMSLPHFYHGDPILKDAVHGLDPREKDHDFYFVVEPTTGITLDVAIRLQVNIMLQSSKQVRIFKKTPKKIFFPMFWFEARAGIPDDKVFMVQLLTHLPMIMIVLGLVLMIVGILVLSKYRIKPETQHQFSLEQIQNLKNKKMDIIKKILGLSVNHMITEGKEVRAPPV